ncbi:hypothetical protein BU17DRAFT_98255 [Hysterangium stoloniferum]|nr:hypothetical protein BU17DRAFT_98255 [Hysterangium stoloniferum]
MIPIFKRLKRAFLLYPAESEPLGSFLIPPQQLRSKGSLSPSVGLLSDTFQSNAQEQTRSQGFGIEELEPGISPLIDIVAIHGLDGHREASWTADNGKLWLRDLLPRDVPSARILTYGYDAYTESTATSSTQTLDDHAENFLARLAALRATSDTTKRPIIFIAHSLGGIILKHALIRASQAHRGHLVEHKWIALSTYGILFLATPHQGTTAITNPANQLLKLASLSSKTNNVLLKHLISNSEWLQQQSSSYSAISTNFHTKFFHESLKTVLPDKSSQIIVPKFSAMISGANMEAVGMAKDHNGMTKFASESDDDFIFISMTIQDMIKKAPPPIQLRWTKFEHAEVESTGMTYRAKLRPSPRFLGQEEYLSTLRKFFGPDDSQPWRHFLLYGMAGVGKTQICLKFIEDVLANDYNYWRIVWIDATDTMTLQNGFASIADDPDVRAQGVERSSDAVVEWLSHNRKKWLLILDNADGMDDEILQYLDKIRLIHALITSRSPVLGAHVQSCIEILPMDEDSAISLFWIAGKLQKESDSTMVTMSKHIVTTLGSLPLAVDIAGATISAGLCTLDDYLKMYQTQTANLLDANHPSLKGASRYNHTVYSALNVSYNLIETSVTFSETAQNALFILRVLSYFHHQNIMETMFKQAAESIPTVINDEQLQTTTSDLPTHLLKCNEDGEWTSMEFRQAMQVLCDYSLLFKGDDAHGSLFWTIHPVIHTWCRDRALRGNNSLYICTARALLVGAIPSGDSIEDIMRRRNILLHIQAFRSSSCGGKDLNVYYDDMFSKFSMILREFGHWEIANAMQKILLTKRDNVLGAQHSDTIEAKANLAKTYSDLGRLKEAEVLQLQVLEAQQLILGPEHPDTILAKANLAITYRDLGWPKEAEVLQLQVWEARQLILGPEHPDTIRAKANLARTYSDLGRTKEAEVLELQVLEAQQLILAPEHPDTILAKANLASTYSDLGRTKEAEVLELQVLEALQLILGPEHPDTILAKANLARTYIELGRPKEAEVLYLQVLEAQQPLLGPEHPYTIQAKANLARTYSELGRPKEAEVLELQVLEVRQIILGPEHPDTIQAKANLARTYSDLGRPKEAEVLELHVLEARQLILGPEHPDTILAKANLASTYSDLGRPKEAEVLELQVLEAQQLILGPEHPDTILAKANLASTYSDLGRPKEAEVLELQVLEAQQLILGPEHPGTIRAKANLARTYSELGRPKEAEVLELQVLEVRQIILGPEHPDTIQAKANLASTHSDLGRPKEAEVLQLQVLEAQQLILGPEHPGTIRAKANLARTYSDLGRPKEAEVLQLQVLEAQQLILGPEHPGTILAKANLARTYSDLGRPKEAEVLELQVLEARQLILGPEHPGTIRAKANLASIYNKLGRPKEAEVLELQVLEARQLILGPEHPGTILAKANLARTYSDLGRPKEAEVLQLQVLEAQQLILDPEHPGIIQAMANLARTYSDLGRPKEAEVLELQVLETQQLILGPEHSDTILAKANLARTYSDLGRPKEAEVLQLQVLEARQLILGPEHPGTIRAKANLARTYSDLGRPKEAEVLQLQVLEAQQLILGPEHPDTILAKANLASIYNNLGMYKEAEVLELHVLES